MTAHDDAMPDDLSDAEAFSLDDDLYILNQNDYRDEDFG